MLLSLIFILLLYTRVFGLIVTLIQYGFRSNVYRNNINYGFWCNIHPNNIIGYLKKKKTFGHFLGIVSPG